MTSPHDTPMPRPYAMVVDDPDLDVTDTSYRNDEAPSIGWSDNDLEVYVQAWWGIDVPEAGPFQVSAQLPLAIEPDEALTDLHSWVPDGHSHSAATPCDTSTQAALLFIETLRRVRELLAKTSGTAAEAARGAAGGKKDFRVFMQDMAQHPDVAGHVVNDEDAGECAGALRLLCFHERGDPCLVLAPVA